MPQRPDRHSILIAFAAKASGVILVNGPCQQSQERTQRLRVAVAESEQAVELARTRHERGHLGYLEVLSAKQELMAARSEAVRSRTDEVLAMVDVYRALGGAPSS